MDGFNYEEAAGNRFGLRYFGVVLLLVFSKAIGSGIKAGVETFGPEVTQTPITLESVDLSAFSGSGAISG